MPRRPELVQVSKQTNGAVSIMLLHIGGGEEGVCLGVVFIERSGKQEAAIRCFFPPPSFPPSLPPPVFAGRAKVKSPVSSMRQRRSSKDGADASGSTGHPQRAECAWPRGSCMRGREAEGGGSERKNGNRKLLFISVSARRRVRRPEVSLQLKLNEGQRRPLAVDSERFRHSFLPTAISLFNCAPFN